MIKLSLEAKLLAFPTSCLSDAMDELGIYGVLNGVTAVRTDQARVVGRALPVQFKRKSGDPDAWRFGGGVGKPLEQVLQGMSAGQIIIMDLGGTMEAASWGGLASRLAQLRGVRGTVVWGACRDVDEIRASGYPVWSAAYCPRRSRNEFTFGSFNEALQIGQVKICPNDIIVADSSGVVCIPEGRAHDILELAEKIERQEALLEDQVMNNRVQSWDEI
jgi:regulator of RNase E activity RraA